jgi:isopentenyl-diphosphate delta-isomerase
MVMDTLILVDTEDRERGFEEKEICHLIPTKLHRAFSIFIINEKGEMLIHKRAGGKKTWPGFWTNACCSHPRKGETLVTATKRRLKEELAVFCPVTHLFSFRYSAEFDATYGENEIDHVFLGTYNGVVKPDPKEIEEWKFVNLEELAIDVEARGEGYTPWFKKALPKVMEQVSCHVSGTKP